MKNILKKHKFKGSGDTYYRKVGKNTWLEYNLDTKVLYLTDGKGAYIPLERPCSTATELNSTLIWYFEENKTPSDLPKLIIGFIVGILYCYYYYNR